MIKLERARIKWRSQDESITNVLAGLASIIALTVGFPMGCKNRDSNSVSEVALAEDPITLQTNSPSEFVDISGSMYGINYYPRSVGADSILCFTLDTKNHGIKTVQVEDDNEGGVVFRKELIQNAYERTRYPHTITVHGVKYHDLTNSEYVVSKVRNIKIK